MLARLVFVGALLGATCAWGQQPEVSAEQVAAARAEADAIIARSEASAFFENATSSETPQVRHKRSGLICSFNYGDPRDVIRLYPVVEGGPPQGDDVGCATWRGTTYVSTFATRYPQQYDADELFSYAIADIRQHWDNVRPFEDSFPVSRVAGQDMPLVAAFSAEREGMARSTVVVLRNIGEWSFKVRATGRPDDPEITTTATLAFALSLPGGREASEAGRSRKPLSSIGPAKAP